jgi:hypothetical protein
VAALIERGVIAQTPGVRTRLPAEALLRLAPDLALA